MAEPWKRADELISDVEEDLIDTPATIAAFGDPELRGVGAMADVPFPLQTIEPPEETEAERASREAQEERERRAAADEAPSESPVAAKKGEDSMATGYPCSQCDAVLPTDRGRKTHEGRVHGKTAQGSPTSARKATTRTIKTRRRRPAKTTRRSVRGAVAAVASGEDRDELDRVRGIMLAIEQLSAPAQHYLRYLLEQETA
jgi:hypothetical protein